MSPRWDYHDAAHLIPVDRQAERTVAGLAVVSGTQARLVAALTTPDSFHDRALYEIVLVAAEILNDGDGPGEWADVAEHGDHRLVVHGAQARATAIASTPGIELSYVTQLVVERGAMVFDDALAGRLEDVALTRAEIAGLVERLAGLGVDVGWLTELDARLAAIAGALLAAATGLGALINGDGPEADVIDALLDAGRYVGVGRDEIAQAVLAATEGGHP